MIVVIVAGGNIDIEFTRGFIEARDESSLFIVACDKGFEACERLKVKPDMAIGDFDSAGKAALERAKALGIKTIELNPIKDDTDVEAALKYVFTITSPTDEIYLLGATGTRLDHVLGNIHLLGMALKNDRRVKMIDNHNSVQMIGPGETWTVEDGQRFGKYISVLPFMGPVRGLSMAGFKYEVQDVNLEGFNTLTVSNELVDGYGKITIEDGYLLVMETQD